MRAIQIEKTDSGNQLVLGQSPDPTAAADARR